MKKGMDNYIVGLDVGSATTRMAVGAFRSREGEDVPELQILAAAETPSQGIHRGGTEIGLGRGLQLKNRKTLSPEIIIRMVSYFARHEVDKRAKNFGNDDFPSTGYIAWLLWGGDPGREWALDIKQKLVKLR
jgi:hypothetical protein